MIRVHVSYSVRKTLPLRFADFYAGKDPKYAKEPAWAKKGGEDDAIPATESHTGTGQPTGTDGAAGTQATPAGQTAAAPAAAGQ